MAVIVNLILTLTIVETIYRDSGYRIGARRAWKEIEDRRIRWHVKAGRVQGEKYEMRPKARYSAFLDAS